MELPSHFNNSNTNDTLQNGVNENESSDNLSSRNYTAIAPETAEANVTVSNKPKKAEVATYVYNDDDDSLDVSLYIDSVPKGKATVSKGEQQTFGNFSLTLGFHRFKIVWEDPSPKKVYESEQNEEIKGDDAVILYTTEHREPEEHDLTVSVKNENDKKTTAYLYIDGIYESDKEISESSTDDFSSVSVKEGTHDISLKWLDPYTNDEYEVKKRITIEGDANVIFVASKGTSFSDNGKSIDTTDYATPEGNTNYESTGTSSGSSAFSGYTDHGRINSSSTNDSAISSTANNVADNSSEAVNTSNTTADTIADIDGSTEGISNNTFDPTAIKTLSAKESPIDENKKPQDTGWEDVSIIYPLVLVAAIYFVLRH